METEKNLERIFTEADGTDAVLLAACVSAKPGEVVADLGAGTGAVGIMVGLRTGADLLLVERDPDLAELCRENLGLIKH